MENDMKCSYVMQIWVSILQVANKHYFQGLLAAWCSVDLDTCCGCFQMRDNVKHIEDTDIGERVRLDFILWVSKCYFLFP
jgi:hypothetical protein